MKLFSGSFLGRKMSKRTMSSGGKSGFRDIYTRSCLLDLANWLHDELASFALNTSDKSARKFLFLNPTLFRNEFGMFIGHVKHISTS